MDVHENHKMYNRLLPGLKGYTEAFLNGVAELCLLLLENKFIKWEN